MLLQTPLRAAQTRPLHMVPARLVKLAATLKQLDEADDAEAITSLSKMSLPQMTAQIRDIEQRAQMLAQEEANEEFRVKSLLQNLLHQNQPGQGAAYPAASSSRSPSVSPQQPQSRTPSAAERSKRRESVGSSRLLPLLESPVVSSCPLNIRVVPSAELAETRKRQATAGAEGTLTFSPFQSS